MGIHAEGGVTADLRQGGAARGDDRGAAGHSLEDRQAEALAQRGEDQAHGAGVQVPQRPLGGIPLEAHEVAEPERLHPLAHGPRVRRLAVAPDDQPRAAPPPEDRERVEQAQQVLVGQQVPDVEQIRALPRAEPPVRPVGRVRVRVIARVDDPDLVRRDPVALRDVAARALRVGDEHARAAKNPGHQRAEVVLLARVLGREEERQEVVDHGHLGDGGTEDRFRDHVEQRLDAGGPGSHAKRGLHPDQAHEVPPETALGTRERRGGQDPSPEPAQRLGRGGVDAEAIPKRVERADQVDGVEAEAGRALADDGRVDADATTRAHRVSHAADITRSHTRTRIPS